MGGRIKTITCRALAASAFLALLASPAAALMQLKQLKLEQVADDVVASYSGVLDLSGWNYAATLGVDDFGAISPTAPAFGHVVSTDLDLYEFPYDPGEEWAAFGAGGDGSTLLFSGDVFGFEQDPTEPGSSHLIFVPEDYIFGDALSGSFTFEGVGLADLGVTGGVCTYALPLDTIVLTVGASPVPLPAEAPLLAASLGGLAFAARRRRRG